MKINTKNSFCLVGLLALPVLTGCGGSSSSGTAVQPLAPRTASATLPNGLTATLTEDRTAVPIGGMVTYTMTLTNPTAQAITYQSINESGLSPNGLAALSVANPSGQTVYPLGPFGTAIGIGPPVTIKPGQSLSDTQTVSTENLGLIVTQGYSAAGNYTAKADFIAGGTVGPVGVAAQ